MIHFTPVGSKYYEVSLPDGEVLGEIVGTMDGQWVFHQEYEGVTHKRWIRDAIAKKIEELKEAQ